MKRLTLHIGAHKTGSTSIQNTMARNEAHLRAQGLGHVHSAEMPNLHPYLAYVNPKPIPGGFKAADPVQFADMLAADPADHVFGSSENFSFFFQPSAINTVARALRARFDKILIVAYLRRQDRHAVSHHMEGARPDRLTEGMLWGHALTALPRPTPRHQLYLDYDARIRLWENAFGAENLAIRAYDRSLLTQGDVVDDIFALMGISTQGLVRVPDSNVSLNRIRAKVGHLANEIIADPKITTSLLWALPGTGARMLPSQDQARAFLDPYREGNRRLNQRLNITALPDLFPDDFADYPAEATSGFGDVAVEPALRVLVNHIAKDRMGAHGLSVADLRLAAETLRATAPQVALRLVRTALELQPDAPLLRALREEIERDIAARHQASDPKPSA